METFSKYSKIFGEFVFNDNERKKEKKVFWHVVTLYDILYLVFFVAVRNHVVYDEKV